MQDDCNLLFGVAAVQLGRIDTAQLAQASAVWAARHTKSVADYLVERGWLTPDERAELDRTVTQHVSRSGGDVDEAMRRIDEIVPFDGVGEPSPEEPTDEFAETFVSDVVTPEPVVDNESAAAEHGTEEGAEPPVESATAPSENSTDADKSDEFAGTVISQAPPTRESTESVDMPWKTAGWNRDDSSSDEQPDPGSATVVAGGAPIGKDQPVVMETIAYKSEHRSRYSLTRICGEGGLGQVWLAVDPNLNRQIALKNVLPGKDQQPDARKRLVQEAQITGQLEHPNIIPVYELEEAGADGAPYYTMRFLRGQTLKEKIVDYHKRKAGGRADPMDLPQLLNAFVDICNAMAYAGSRLIVHRDLKPQNVMIGDFGEVLVLDWGLAEKLEGPPTDSGREIRVSGDASETSSGHIVGSPAYMAPEQALGRTDLIDQRTDVYGLGAILFHILCGRAPHRGRKTGNSTRDTMELLNRIATGETPRPREVDPSVPAALDAVCANAMANKGPDRYTSAAELARDVERFLADEPVSVYEETLIERAGRWLRRHRSWALSIAVALIVISVCAGAAAVIVDGARRREARAHEATREARNQATAHFKQARRTVDELFTGVSEALQYYPGVQRLRTELLRSAAADYEEFAATRSNDPELRFEFAMALVRLGDVRRLLLEFDEAEAAYQSAIQVFENHPTRGPDDHNVTLALAGCHRKLGLLHAYVSTAADASEQAEAQWSQARLLIAPLLEALPEDPEVRRAQAELDGNLGVLLARSARRDQGFETLKSAEAAFEALAEETEETSDYESLAKTRIALGELLTLKGEDAAAESTLLSAIDAWLTLVGADPDHPPWLHGAADTRVALANALHSGGRIGDRISLYEAAITDYRALVESRPDVPVYREGLATAGTDLAQVLSRVGRCEEAQQYAEDALRLFMGLNSGEHATYDHYAREIYARVTLGQILRARGDFTLAETAFTGAIASGEELVSTLPDAPNFRRVLGETRNNLGILLLLTDRPEPARQEFLRARDDFDVALTLTPNDSFARNGRAWSLTYLGDSLMRLQRPSEARGFYEEAIAARGQLTANPNHHCQLAWLLVNCLDAELRDPVRALSVADELVRRAPRNTEYATVAAAAWYRRGEWDQSLAHLNTAATHGRTNNDPLDFWRAMVQWQQGDHDTARSTLKLASDRMDQHTPGDLKLRRLRMEAAALMAPE